MPRPRKRPDSSCIVGKLDIRSESLVILALELTRWRGGRSCVVV